MDNTERQAEDAERFVHAGKHLAELQALLKRIREAARDLEAGKKKLAGSSGTRSTTASQKILSDLRKPVEESATRNDTGACPRRISMIWRGF